MSKTSSAEQTALPKNFAAMKMSPKKMSPKKMSSKMMTAPKNTAALKKKIATKRATKVGKSMAKKDGQGKRKAITTSGEERSARATRRNLAKEAPATLDVATGGPLEVSLSITKSRQMYP